MILYVKLSNAYGSKIKYVPYPGTRLVEKVYVDLYGMEHLAYDYHAYNLQKDKPDMLLGQGLKWQQAQDTHEELEIYHKLALWWNDDTPMPST